LGGLLLGLGTGILTHAVPLSPFDRLVVASGIVALAGFCELAGTGPPSIRRQVDETWLRKYRGWVYGLGFGVQLGVGLTTIVTTWAVYATVCVLVLSGSVQTAVILGIWFGIARGAPVLLGLTATTPDALMAVHRRLSLAQSVIRKSTAFSLLAVAIALPVISYL
jgi:hypothetical protein